MSDCGDCFCDCTGVDVGSVDAGNGDCDCVGDGCDCDCCGGDGCDCNGCENCLNCCYNEGFTTCCLFSCSSPANPSAVIPGDEQQQQQQRKDSEGQLCCLCVTLCTAFLGIAGVIILIVLTTYNKH